MPTDATNDDKPRCEVCGRMPRHLMGQTPTGLYACAPCCRAAGVNVALPPRPGWYYWPERQRKAGR